MGGKLFQIFQDTWEVAPEGMAPVGDVEAVSGADARVVKHKVIGARGRGGAVGAEDRRQLGGADAGREGVEYFTGHVVPRADAFV